MTAGTPSGASSQDRPSSVRTLAGGWVDLSTPDVDAATRFYADLFGWSIEPHPSPFGPYYVGQIGADPVAGLMAQDPDPDQPEHPAAWTVFVAVADVDGCLDVVARAGGRVLAPAVDLPDARIAVVRDPTGAVLGLIAGRGTAGSWLADAPGSVCWTELLTRDTERAERFYDAVFGWQAETTGVGASAYTTFTADGEPVAGMMAMPAEVPADAPASWGPYFCVDDCEATERRAVALGGLVLRPTTRVGEQRFAVLADPAGASFQVLERRG